MGNGNSAPKTSAPKSSASTASGTPQLTQEDFKGLCDVVEVNVYVERDAYNGKNRYIMPSVNVGLPASSLRVGQAR